MQNFTNIERVFKEFNLYKTYSSQLDDNTTYYIFEFPSAPNEDVELRITKNQSIYTLEITKGYNTYIKKIKNIKYLNRILLNDFEFIRVLMRNPKIHNENKIDFLYIANSKNDNFIKKWNKRISQNNDFVFIRGHLDNGITRIETNFSNMYLFFGEDESETIYENYLHLLKEYGKTYNKIKSTFYKNNFEIILKK